MREMKDSGIEWIGAIPTTWHTQKMKYISNFIQNKYSSDYGLLPYIGLENIASWSGSFISTNSQYDREQSLICEPEDILFGKLRPYLAKVYMNDRLCCCSNEFAVIRVNGQNKRYMWYQLLSHGFIFEIDRSTYGTKMPRANAEFIRNVFVALPSEIEQQKIANYLDKMCAEIDAVLEKTRASIEEYKKLKQAVITQAVTKGIRGDRPMKDSGIEWIGEIPAEWKVNLIKNVATTGSGGTPESGNPSLYDGDINWICSYDLKERPITKSERRLTQLGADSIAGNVQLKGSVLVAMYGGSGTIGNSGILECEAKTNQAICSIKFNNGYITDYFGFYYILSIRKYWMLFAVGTRKDPNISQDIVRKMPCILPPIAEQEEIVAYCNKACDQLDTLITKKQQYLTEIENYKKSLIYEYVTGKREV